MELLSNEEEVLELLFRDISADSMGGLIVRLIPGVAFVDVELVLRFKVMGSGLGVAAAFGIEILAAEVPDEDVCNVL